MEVMMCCSQRQRHWWCLPALAAVGNSFRYQRKKAIFVLGATEGASSP